MSKPTVRRRRLTTPLISCAHTREMRVVVTGEMYDASMPGLARNDTGTIRVVPVADMATGEEQLLICPAILISALQRDPDGYVGGRYEILTGDVVPGKNYRHVEVYRLEDDEPEGSE